MDIVPMNNAANLISGLLIEYFSRANPKGPAHRFDMLTLNRRLRDYKQSAKVLRQINSDKMETCRLKKNFLDWGTFVSTLILTFLGFYSVDKVHSLLFATIISKDLLELVFNGLILAVLIMTALQIAGRFGEKQVEHFGTVQRLTDFITDLDDMLLIKELTANEIKRRLKELNQRYKGITSSLPENSDKEWLKAKQKLQNKKLTSMELRVQHLFLILRKIRRSRKNAR